MAVYRFTSTTPFGEFSVDSTKVKLLQFTGADFASEFAFNLTQFEFDPLAFNISAQGGFVRDAEVNLISEFSIDATNVFEGDIINNFGIVITSNIAASATVIKESFDTVFRPRFRALPFPRASVARGIDETLVADFTQNAYPFGIFFEGEADLTTRGTVSAAGDQIRGLIDAFSMNFVLRDGTEFVDGQNRKFTANQIATIRENRGYIVDLVEIYVNYIDTDLPIHQTGADPATTQWPLPPVLRWNSSGRDLNIVDYKGNTHNYKGKNVIMGLPPIEYNGLFNKKTVKIEINGLLGFFQKAITLGYLKYAKVVLAKAVYGTIDNPDPSVIGITGQVDNAVVLLRGSLNNAVLSNNLNNQTMSLEITHGFYDYDLVNTVRTNGGSYGKYLDKTGYSDEDTTTLGRKLNDNIYWGSNTI